MCCLVMRKARERRQPRPVCVDLQDGNGNTKRSRVSNVSSRVTHHSCHSQPSWPLPTLKRLLRLPQNSSQVCLGLKARFCRADLSRLLIGLDNLPSEISFLLTEIQHIDVRSQGKSHITPSPPPGFLIISLRTPTRCR